MFKQTIIFGVLSLSLSGCYYPAPTEQYPAQYNPYVDQALTNLGNTYYNSRQQYLEENQRQRDRLYQSYDLMNRPYAGYGQGRVY